jgi:cysteine sulfinate desulfinase/cysteine desulfurase-like protein
MIYFDHAATTPVHPRVVEAMTPYLTQVFGNPSSVHGFGRVARQALEKARDEIAHFMDADPQSLIFTSGGTEADNMAVIGGAMAQRERGRHVITSQVEHHAVLHASEHQAFGLLPVRARQLPVDMLSVSAHKINGPKGVGALYLARKVPFEPTVHGGSQERKRRAGTENLAGIVGFAEATKIAAEEMEDRVSKYRRMKETMLSIWQEAGIAHHVNGHPEKVMPHILNVSFPGVHTETMLMNLDLVQIAAASGSACTSGSLELSHVLKAMNLEETVAQSAIRFSFGITNTVEEAERAAQAVSAIVKRLVRHS